MSSISSPIGLDCYLNPSTCTISAIVKFRYGDFVVHEVSPESVESTLTSTEPCCPEVPPVDAPPPDYISQSIVDQLDDLKATKSDRPVFIPLGGDGIENTKPVRTSIHNFIKSSYANILISTTLNDAKSASKAAADDIPVPCIFVSHAKHSGSGSNAKAIHDDRSSQRNLWPKSTAPYIRFTLYKHNIDTMEAVQRISRIVHANVDSFHYAGTKDRRACTTQFMTAWHVKERDLLRVNGCMHNVRVGHCSYVTEPLRFGELAGNRFTIVLRDVQGEPDEIVKRCDSVRDNGFINYFGSQRFGTSTHSTTAIGLAILKKAYKEAVCMILAAKGSPNDGNGDPPPLHAAKLVFVESLSCERALQALGSFRCVEREMWAAGAGIEPLSKKAKVEEEHSVETDWCKMLKALPSNRLLLYLHAYQSLLFNRLVSHRIGAAHPPLDNIATDVLIPVPGTDTKTFDLSDKLESMLDADGLSLDSFSDTLCGMLSGAERYMIRRPTDFHYRLVRYADPKRPLIQTDLMRMTGEEAAEVPQDGAAHLAVVLDFTLPPSSYATMLLRELLHTDTSSAAQACLTHSD